VNIVGQHTTLINLGSNKAFASKRGLFLLPNHDLTALAAKSRG